uniref:Uncharacterized protein n=1 Tax=Medicago truncatula TaxID=3880 RepID=I3T095_MEDTR|nr:unknown [Medicago truncatula]
MSDTETVAVNNGFEKLFDYRSGLLFR